MPSLPTVFLPSLPWLKERETIWARKQTSGAFFDCRMCYILLLYIFIPITVITSLYVYTFAPKQCMPQCQEYACFNTFCVCMTSYVSIHYLYEYMRVSISTCLEGYM